MPTCKTCRWYEYAFGEEGENAYAPETGLCGFPRERMPLSMQGYAQRERETVLATADTCPTHEAPQ